MWRFLRNKTNSGLIYFLREIPGKRKMLLTLCNLAFDLTFSEPKRVKIKI